jgi:hypothetical protein
MTLISSIISALFGLNADNNNKIFLAQRGVRVKSHFFTGQSEHACIRH